MAGIGLLLCGKADGDGLAKSALGQLCRSIDGFYARALAYLSRPATDDTIALGPFCARVLLENSCAALLGRLDTFRMLYLSEFQTQPEYEPGKRVKSAFSWGGDVIPEEKAGPLWSADYDVFKISRALFSKHLDHVYWKPAVEKMLDFVSALKAEQLLAEILTFDADTYINQTKGRGTQLYSTLSKGVHWEFFSSILVFDEATVKTAIRDTCLLVGHLGLTSHFIPTAYASLPPEVAIEAYLAFRKDIQ